MAKCDVCGNDYDKAFQVIAADRPYIFDCFECAIFALAPRCRECGVTIIGHGVESKGVYYCCANCAHKAGVKAAQDRV